MTRLGALLDRGSSALGLTADRAGLLRTGVLLGLLYLAYAVAYPEREVRILRYAFGWGGTLLLLLLWLRGAQQIVQLERDRAVPWKLLLGAFVVFAALTVGPIPFHSTDLFAYTNTGHLQAHYGLNPYVNTAVDVPGWENDPLFFSYWSDTPCVYGFLFALITRGVASLGGGDLATTLLIFRLMNVFVLAGTAWLVISTLRRHELPRAGLAAFTLLWSPLVLLHVIANGHNDILMALCILIALRLALDGRWLGVVPAILVGALIKHIALALLPFVLLWLVRRHGWRKAAVSTVVGLVPVVLCVLAYADGFADARWADIAADITTPRNSLQAALVYPYEQLVGDAGTFRHVVRIAFGLAFLTFFGLRWLRSARRATYTSEALIEDALTVLVVLMCIASSLWHPWYVVMFLPAVFLLPPGHRIRRLALWIAAFQMIAFTHLSKARVLDAVVMLALPMWLAWREQRAKGGPTQESEA